MFHTGVPPPPEDQRKSRPQHQPQQQQFYSSGMQTQGTMATSPQNDFPPTPSSDHFDNDGDKNRTHRDDVDSDTNTNSKQNRLRKACDSCSLRKVKCDAEQPCRACRTLNIPCTFQRPTRRRGPPNRLAESLRKAYRDSHSLPSNRITPSPIKPSERLATPSSAQPSLSAESIGPIDLVRALVDDYFLFLHPLQPFPHEPTYRKGLADRKDISDPSFLALTAAMIGSLTAAFPRRPRKRLKNLGNKCLFRNSVDFIRHCQKIASDARGSGYLERPDLNTSDAATSYYFFTMSAHMLDWRTASLYVGECFTIVRCLLNSTTDEPQTLPSPTSGEGEGKGADAIDYIERELTKRLYWTIFVTARSGTPFGVTLDDLYVKPPTPSKDHPPLPLEIDDQYIHRTLIEPQPANVLSKLTGFNANCHIYLTHDPLIALESSYGIDHVFDWERQKAVLKESIERVKNCFDRFPEQLLVWRAVGSMSPSSGSLSLHGRTTSQPPTPNSEYRQQQHIAIEGHKNAYEIQKANIHASYLSSRSYFIEKYCDLIAARGMDLATEGEIRKERESICDALLDVLSSIRRINMEPNSVAFCMKIRQIASTLLPSARPGQQVEESTTLSHDGMSTYYLRSFVETLMALGYCMSAADSGGDIPNLDQNDITMEQDNENEEQELRQWAGLRERQREFYNGGAKIANT